MKQAGTIIIAGMLAIGPAAGARGVSPYLPLNLEPEIESQIERVLILAGKPVMRRPIAAATVLDALPKACKVDHHLCEQVGRYLTRYTHVSDLTHASLEGGATHGADTTLPDRYGLPNRSSWDASASLYWQPNDYLLVSAGADAYDGRVDYSGSMLSLGFSKAQLDVGYKPHWFSPLSDSSMLMSSEAPTMPSVSISNYEPLTRLGFSYEIFEARMSRQDIVYTPAPGGITHGYPRLGGLQLSIEPASGWALGLNRLVQFGGGARGGSLGGLWGALFNPSRAQSGNQDANPKAVNQEASVTSSFLFPGRVPFAIYAEYAGEDTSRGRNELLGNAALSWGIHFPRLAERFDLSLEVSEWQTAWYTHSVWLQGMTNDGLVTGNWFGDQRVFNNAVGGHSGMARLNWDAWFGGQVQLRYRVLQNEDYEGQGIPPVDYKRFHEISLGYARPWLGLVVGGEFDTGSDVFGRSFSRLAGFVRYDDPNARPGAALLETVSGNDEAPEEETGQLFVDAGANNLRIRTDLTGLTPKVTGPATTGAHLALGARRAVTEHGDLGARVEYDDLDGRSLLGVRLIDYRYRFRGPLAIVGFLGAARYDLATPAYGFYYGTGLQWRDLVPHVDAGFEVRYYDSIARDRVLPNEPQAPRSDSFYDVWGGVLTLTYHF